MKTTMKTRKKLMKATKRIKKFILQTIKNYQSMKRDLSKIFCCLCLLMAIAACNVTRKVTTESSFYQRGDTTYTITTKTTESYDASKKNYYSPLNVKNLWK